MKKLVYASLILLGLIILGAALFVQSQAFSRKLRPLVLSPLTDTFGPALYAGTVKASLIPLFVEVRDIVLLDQQAAPVITIRKLRLYINPIPLLVNRLSITHIAIMDPTAVLERAPTGQFNVDPLIETAKQAARKAQGRPSGGLSVQLRTISVRNGRCAYRDRAIARVTAITDVTLGARVNLAGQSATLTIKSAQATISGTPVADVPLRVAGAVAYVRGRVMIPSLQASAGDAQVVVSGTVTSVADPVVQLSLRLKAGPLTMGRLTGLPAAPAAHGPSLTATVQMNGALKDPALSGKITVSGLTFAHLRLHDAGLSFAYRKGVFEAQGKDWALAGIKTRIAVQRVSAQLSFTTFGAEIRQAEIVTEDLLFRLSGQWDAATGLDSVLTLESSGACRTLGALMSCPLEGRMRVRGRLTGPPASPVFDGTLSAYPFGIRGVRFDEISGKVKYDDRVVSLAEVEIKKQEARYLLAGSIDLRGAEPAYSAHLSVKRSDVASIVAIFYEQLPLDIAVSGVFSLSGTGKQFSGEGSLALEQGTAYGESFRSGEIEVSLTPDNVSFPRVLLHKGSGTVKAAGRIGFDGQYEASLEAEAIDLSEVDHLRSLPLKGRGSLSISAQGSFARPELSASLRVLDFSSGDTSWGALNADLTLENGALGASASLDDERLSLKGSLMLHAPYAWDIDASLSLDGLDPFSLLGKTVLAGRPVMEAEGGVSLRGRGSSIARMHGGAAFTRLKVRIDDYEFQTVGETSVRISGGNITIEPVSITGPGTKIFLSRSTGPITDFELPLSGSFNLSLLRLLSRDLEYGAGEATMELHVTEPWTNPAVTGKLRVTNGEVKVKNIQQRFTALQGTIEFDRDRILTDRITGVFGGGTMDLSGSVLLRGLSLRSVTMRLAFENVTVRYPEGMTALLSGDLTYDGDAGEQGLAGDVQIKRARYDKRIAWKTMLLETAGGPKSKKKTDLGRIGETQLNVQVSGKENILLDNNLAKIPMTVDFVLRGTVNQPQFLGRIEARKGTFYFRNNDFTIAHARIDFVDPGRINPLLDIQAETRVREYRVQLALAGTAERATLTLVSDPPLSERDILSLLAFGKTGEELTGKTGDVSKGEAASFATGAFQDIFERRARSLTGLDRFQVDPYMSKANTPVPRVTVGKELVKDRLTMSYSSNLQTATAEQAIRMEYRLNENVSLVGEMNEYAMVNGDIKFRFEFK